MKSFIMGVIGVLSFVFLLNPTMGIFEIPDTLPIVGHLDEATAMALLIMSLQYFGVDITHFSKKKKTEKETA